MSTGIEMYEFEVQYWDGVSPDGFGDRLDVYPFLDRAWEALGHPPGSRCPDAMNNRDQMRQIVNAIKPDDRGVKPRVRIVQAKD